MLVYGVRVAQATADDVVTRRLTITVNGNDGGSIDTPGSTVAFGGLKFSEGDAVRLELCDIDDAGNVSKPAVCEFTAHDTIAPDAPAGFAVELEREDKDPAPEKPAHHVVAKFAKEDGEGKLGPDAAQEIPDVIEPGERDRESNPRKHVS